MSTVPEGVVDWTKGLVKLVMNGKPAEGSFYFLRLLFSQTHPTINRDVRAQWNSGIHWSKIFLDHAKLISSIARPSVIAALRRGSRFGDVKHSPMKYNPIISRETHSFIHSFVYFSFARVIRSKYQSLPTIRVQCQIETKNPP